MVIVQTLSVGQLFRNPLRIPMYQREFVWAEENVRQFVDAIIGQFLANANDNLFVGPLVLSPQDNQETCYIVVDGQQRITTLFLLFSSLYDYFKELVDADKDELISEELKVYRDPIVYFNQQTGTLRPRLTNEDEALGAAIHSLMPLDVLGKCDVQIQESLCLKPLGTAKSRKRAKKARDLCDGMIRKNFDSVTDLRQFMSFVGRKVELLPYKADLETALVVFESLNARGIPLSSFDLIKNQVLKDTKPDGRLNVARAWKSLVETFSKPKLPTGVNPIITEVDPLRFLRYYLIGKHGDPDIKKNRLHVRTFELEKPSMKSTSDWIKKLGSAAKLYMELLNGIVDDQECRPLRRLATFFPRQRQHLCLLLAASLQGLPKEDVERLARLCESVVAASGLTRENSTRNEQRFLKWARELFAEHSRLGFSLEDLIKKWQRELQADLTSQLNAVLDSGRLDDKEQRYLLILAEDVVAETPVDLKQAKFATVLDEDDDGLNSFYEGGDVETAADSLGNLYVHTGPPCPRAEVFADRQTTYYQQSEFLTTRAIGQRQGLPESLSSIAQTGKWNEKQIDFRKDAILTLATNWLGFERKAPHV